jgi:hypothetical protein
MKPGKAESYKRRTVKWETIQDAMGQKSLEKEEGEKKKRNMQC